MIVISAESSCDLSGDYIEAHNLTILTHYIVTDKGQFYDGIEVSGKNIIDYKQRKGAFPSSKSPKVEDYRKEFNKCLETAEGVIHITPGIQAYSSFGSASYAAKGIENVYVTDSMQISYGYGLVVKEAVRLRDLGFDANSILKKLDAYKTRVKTYMLIQDFDCIYNVDKSVAKFEPLMKFLSAYPYFCISEDRYKFKGLVFGGRGLLYKNFSRRITRHIKSVKEKTIITSKYNSNELNEFNKMLIKFGGDEFKDIPVSRVSCSEVCRYGGNMLGMVGVI